MIATAQDIRKVRPLSENINASARIDPYIEEAEILYVLPELGAELYKKVNETPKDYSELLNGGYYDSDKKYFQGLLTAISYLAYSRMIVNQSISVTPFGVVNKSASEMSSPVSTQAIITTSEEAKKIGLEFLRQSKEYCQYKGYSQSKTISPYRTKFKSIGK